MKPANGNRAQALSVLYGLVKQGVILSFKTNFFSQSDTGWYPHVWVTTISSHTDDGLREVGHRVLAVLSPLVGSAKVTVVPLAPAQAREDG